MATDCHFTTAEAQVINGSMQPQGLSTKEMCDRFLGSLERDKHAAYSTLIFSYLHYDKEKNLWFARWDADTISALPPVEEIRNQVLPHGLSIPDFFAHFLPRVPGSEHSAFVVRAKTSLRYYPGMQLLFRKSDINSEPGPTCPATAELILSHLPIESISTGDLVDRFAVEMVNAKAFLELLKRVAVYDVDTQLYFPHPRFIHDPELANAFGLQCQTCRLFDGVTADCV